ncbi:MAG: galactose oxidase-like domain-containing protein [Gemmatimonadales bacterium]
MLGSLDLVYVCGNKFLATNATSSAAQVTYRVVGTREAGGLTLREGPGEDPGYSETELETENPGAVELYQDDQLVARRQNQGIHCGMSATSASVVAAGAEATMGKWTAPFAWPIVAVHLHLLPNGKVLSWGKTGVPHVWDPSTKAFTASPSPSWLFCSGHAFLPDGRLLVNGGHISDDHGLPDANLYDPTAATWSSAPPMAKGRWYPTTTTLANGQAVTIAGRDQSGAVAVSPEVWTGSGWRALTGASRSLPYYPRTFLAPNGKVFYAGEKQSTYYLSTSGSGSWSTVGSRRYGTRDYGSAVMYEPGKVLYAGGGRTTNTAEVIDLNQASPTWQWTGFMAYPRRHLNATILPTGQVLVTGGTNGTAFADESRPVYPAELWDPGTGNWTTLASNSVVRTYHTTALLLRDGRVLLTGSGDGARTTPQRNAEIFSPPYLFKGARPSISSSPGSGRYAQSFFIGTSQASTIGAVTLVRLGSVTHAFDSNQRFNRLSFVPAVGGLTVTTPASANLAPPGHYLLFIVNQNGVPSKGKSFRLK